VGYLLKKLVTVLLVLGGLVNLNLYADPASNDTSIDYLIDGYYPRYPETAKATGPQKELILRGEFGSGITR
jgi:hypothetical protein